MISQGNERPYHRVVDKAESGASESRRQSPYNKAAGSKDPAAPLDVGRPLAHSALSSHICNNALGALKLKGRHVADALIEFARREGITMWSLAISNANLQGVLVNGRNCLR